MKSYRASSERWTQMNPGFAAISRENGFDVQSGAVVVGQVRKAPDGWSVTRDGEPLRAPPRSSLPTLLSLASGR